MQEKIKRLDSLIENQSTRYNKNIVVNIGVLILIFILLAINIYSNIKPEKIGNPISVVILIYVALVFFFMISIFCFIRNIIAVIGLNKAREYINVVSIQTSEVENIPMWTFLNGELYDAIDKLINECVGPLAFHLIKKKVNLISLNIRQTFASILVCLTGIAFFVSEVIYFKGANFDHWEVIFGLVMMIVSLSIVFFYMIPRQLIINKKINKNNKNKISEYDYFHAQRLFFTQNVLSKFWNE